MAPAGPVQGVDPASPQHGTSEHRVVARTGQIRDQPGLHSGTAELPDTYSVSRNPQVANNQAREVPEAAQFALQEALEQGSNQAEVPDLGVVEAYREYALQELTELDEEARTKAVAAGELSPTFTFRVGPDARAYRVDFMGDDAPGTEGHQAPEQKESAQESVGVS